MVLKKGKELREGLCFSWGMDFSSFLLSRKLIHCTTVRQSLILAEARG